MDVDVVVEIPKGSRNKYEYDHTLNRIRLDRMLFSSTGYPADYGFVEHTMAEDDEPIDALVLLDDPTFPGCQVNARVVGVFWMRDNEGPDAKLLCVPADDPRQSHIQNLDDVPEHLRNEIGHFFDIYKALEPDKCTDIGGWQDRFSAEAAVSASRERLAARLLAGRQVT
jgi:inorganic pyrophosphatase